GGEAVAGADPAFAGRLRRLRGRYALRSNQFVPATAAFFERRIVHLAHPRIEAGDNARRARLLGRRLERRYAEHRQAVGEGESLGEAAGDAQPGERPRPGAESERVQAD